ncbi:site-specific integrase [Aeromicrobium alkaliterrae]|uniref:Tyrosine-type recombinase/integrase n=1 Tax=Aeromicrobium alkaliterrae TaxID=302168 RepID=A0ABN2JSV3_9ACTN
MKKTKDKNIRERRRADGSIRGYEVRYRDAEKLNSRGYPVVRGKVFRTLDEARDWQARHQIKVRDGRFISPDRSRTPFGDVADEYLSMRGDDLRNRTQQGYRTILNTWLAEWAARPIDNLTASDVKAVIDAMKNARDKNGDPKPRAVQTRHRVFNLISSVFGFAVEMRYVEVDPTMAFRMNSRSRTRLLGSVNRNRFKGRALTPTEAMSIINALPEGRFRLYALLGYYSGFRAGELAGLRVHNLDPLRGTVQVGETVEDISGVLQPGVPKTEDSRDRVVPIPTPVMKQLIDHVASEGLEQNDYVFAGPNPYFAQKNFYNRQWRAACKEVGFWDADAKRVTVRFHDLRVTFASLRAREGMPPHKLRALMGHSDINTTMNVYVQVFGGDPEDAKFADRIFDLTESGQPVSGADVRRHGHAG